MDLASHSARLPGFREQVTEDDFNDDVRLAALLAAQPQESDPRAGDVYHAMTYGWLAGELIRRVDGRSVGTFFADEVARPLGLDVWIGQPARLNPGWPAWSTPRTGGRTTGTQPMLPRMSSGGPCWHLGGCHETVRIGTRRRSRPPAGSERSARSPVCTGVSRMAGSWEASACCLRRYFSWAAPRSHGGWTRCSRRRRHSGSGSSCRPIPRSLALPEMHSGMSGRVGQSTAPASQRVGVSYVINLMRDENLVDPRSDSLLKALAGVVS
jgi:CubicO group peptidase (beta-lactamase class C family)